MGILTNRMTIAGLAAGLAFVALGQTQGQVPARPEFNVADVRVSQKGQDAAAGLQTVRSQINGAEQVFYVAAPVFGQNGQVKLRNATMRQLITQAYKEVFRDEYLTGGPNWLDSDHFDLIAKAPAETPADTLRLMLQSVLAERFHLQVHREQKPMPVYALAAGKNGPKLRPAAGPGEAECKPVAGSGAEIGQHRACHNLTMAILAERLPGMAPVYVDRPVVDLTGITGAYDFQLDWTPRPPGTDVAAGATMFDAVDKELGLKLEERKLPMPTIVIDRVDRTPTEN